MRLPLAQVELACFERTRVVRRELLHVLHTRELGKNLEASFFTNFASSGS